MKVLVKASALLGIGSMTLFGFSLIKNEGDFENVVGNLNLFPIHIHEPAPSVAPPVGLGPAPSVALPGTPTGRSDCKGVGADECRDLAEMKALEQVAARQGVTRVAVQRDVVDGELHKEVHQRTQAALTGVSWTSVTAPPGQVAVQASARSVP